MNNFEFLNRFALVAKKPNLFVVFRAVNPRREPNKRGMITDQVDHIPVYCEYRDGTREVLLFSASSALDELENKELGAIAIKTGGLLMALDCDNPKAIEWVESRLEEPTLITHSGNPNESRHYWFQLSEPIRTAGKINSGKECEIEVKNGANLTVLGTYRKDTSRRYGYIDNPIQPIPSAILEAIRTEYKAKGHLSIAEMSDAEYREHWERDFKIAKSIAEYYRNHCYTGDPETDPIPDHNTWIKVMYGLFSLSVYDEVLELAEMLTWEEYLPDLYRQYQSFESDHEQFGNLINWAKSIGWKLPKELYTAEYSSDEAVLFKASEDKPKAKSSSKSAKTNNFTRISSERVRLDAEKGYYFKVGKHWEYLGWNSTKVELFTADYLLANGSNDDASSVKALMSRERVRWMRLPTDSDPGLVGFKNGVLDCNKGEFRDWLDTDFITRYLDFEYDANASEPRLFLKFLSQMFKDIADEAIPVIQAFLSCLIRGDVRHQTFLAIVGKGGSGKSVLVSVMEAMAGNGNYVSTWLKSLQSEHGTEPLVGKSLITIKEVERGERTSDLPALKSLVGEDEIQVNPKGKPAYSTRIRANLVVLSNTYLDFKDDGEAISRRMVQLPVLQTEADVLARGIDYDLADKLKSEIPQIIAWALRAENPANTLKMARASESIRQSLKSFHTEVDPIAEVADDILEFGIEYKYGSSDLYSAVRKALKLSYPSKTEPSDKALLQVIKSLGKTYGVEVELSRTMTKRLLKGVRLSREARDYLDDYETGKGWCSL